ncbi:DUF6082 family protein [Streptomyces tendae]
MTLENGAALALVAGAAGLVYRERRHWQHNEAAVMGDQLAWLTYLTTHPDFAQFWRRKGLEVEESIELLHVNRRICALVLRHRLGLFRGRRLRCCAGVVVKSECGRACPERFGSFLEAEADGDRPAGGFTGTMHDACARAAENSDAPKSAVLVGE